MENAKTTFESEVCSRCGGSGHYSYCQMYGTTCFRCAGRRITLTKRGAAAQAYFTALCSKPASEVKVGEVVKVCGKFSKVVKVGFTEACKWLEQETGQWHQYYEIETEAAAAHVSAASLRSIRSTPQVQHQMKSRSI